MFVKFSFLKTLASANERLSLVEETNHLQRTNPGFVGEKSFCFVKKLDSANEAKYRKLNIYLITL